METPNKKVVVIGSCGHIGSYLIPMLVTAGYNVITISRGISKPYFDDPSWSKVEKLTLDRTKDPDFPSKIAGLNADIVVDLINFHIEDTEKMVNALRPTKLSHYLFCSSIWAHGRAEILPLNPNDENKLPLDSYGENKFKSEIYLKEQYKLNKFPATIIMPGQICGPGWLIINPWGNLNVKIFETIAKGEQVYLPNWGMETLHHVHAHDVALMFFQAITHREQVLGESFDAVAEESITTYGYAKVMYKMFGKEEKIGFMSWEKWAEYEGNKEEVDLSYYHLARSGHFSIEKAKKLIEYKPKYTIKETLELCIKSYIERRVIKV